MFHVGLIFQGFWFLWISWFLGGHPLQACTVTVLAFANNRSAKINLPFTEKGTFEKLDMYRWYHAVCMSLIKLSLLLSLFLFLSLSPSPQIWNLSDPGGKGYLDKQGFFMALRLVSACQNGKEPMISSIAANDPAPKLSGLEGPSGKSPANKWSVEVCVCVCCK